MFGPDGRCKGTVTEIGLIEVNGLSTNGQNKIAEALAVSGEAIPSYIDEPSALGHVSTND